MLATMRLHNMLPFRATCLGIALLGITAGATQNLCSSENTGADYSSVTNIYQSNGACSNQCSGSYAYAIVQYQSCWCSNYAPADTVSTGQCNVNCPGYPAEQCGDADQGLFGYILVGNPSGTAGGSSTSASSTSIPSSTIQSSTEDPETSYTSTTQTTPTTTSATSSIRTTSSNTPTSASMDPITSVIRTTIAGAVVTQTVTTTPISIPGSHADNLQLHRDNGLGAGAIAGIVIGVLAAVAILAAAGFLLWRRKKNAEDSEKSPYSGPGAKKKIGRNVSVLSKAGLLTRNTGASMGERENDESYYVNHATGQNSVRHSMLFAGAAGVSPTSPLGSSHESNGSRRMSQPMVYDQRLNPSALFSNAEANGSRISMQDTQDYSRPLGVMNPDPRASFDSRLSRTG